MRWLLIGVLVLGACAVVHVDYIDFVRANGITYIGGNYTADERLGRPITDADLGAEQFRVTRRLADSGGSAESDGDAAFVPVGEPVYAVKGYAPMFRLAARRDGRLVLYEADTNPSAKLGRDLLDIDGKVRSIALISGRDGRTVLGRISDPGRVRSASCSRRQWTSARRRRRHALRHRQVSRRHSSCVRSRRAPLRSSSSTAR